MSFLSLLQLIVSGDTTSNGVMLLQGYVIKHGILVDIPYQKGGVFFVVRS